MQGHDQLKNAGTAEKHGEFAVRLRSVLRCATVISWTIAVSAVAHGAPRPTPSCKLTIEGEVKRGESFRHAGPPGLDFMLEAIPSGWIVRMLDQRAPRSEFDFAGLATPPYMSPSPILISTDFSFRAQDAIGWNPRNFQYFRNRAEMKGAIAAYRAYMSAGADKPTADSQRGMAELLKRSSAAAPGKLEILDARLVGGTNNQTGAAALVAGHFQNTAHVLDDPPAGAHPLGWINWIRFRVTLSEQNVACDGSRKARH